MSGFKGTPGPWVVVDEHPDRAVLGIHSCDGDTFVSVYTVDKFADHNANLIAAAPELLEALRQLRDYVEDVLAVSAEDCDQQHPLMLASSVISKALGQ